MMLNLGATPQNLLLLYKLSLQSPLTTTVITSVFPVRLSFVTPRLRDPRSIFQALTYSPYAVLLSHHQRSLRARYSITGNTCVEMIGPSAPLCWNSRALFTRWFGQRHGCVKARSGFGRGIHAV